MYLTCDIGKLISHRSCDDRSEVVKDPDKPVQTTIHGPILQIRGEKKGERVESSGYADLSAYPLVCILC